MVAVGPGPVRESPEEARAADVEHHRSLAIGTRAGAFVTGTLGVAAGVVFTAGLAPCEELDCLGSGFALVVGGFGMAILLPTTGALSGVSGHHWGHYRRLTADDLDRDRIRRRRSLGILSLALGWSAVISGLVAASRPGAAARGVGMGVFAAGHVARWVGLHAVIANGVLRQSPQLSLVPTNLRTETGWHPGVSLTGRF